MLIDPVTLFGYSRISIRPTLNGDSHIVCRLRMFSSRACFVDRNVSTIIRAPRYLKQFLGIMYLIY